jgi:hypothetical protein
MAGSLVARGKEPPGPTWDMESCRVAQVAAVRGLESSQHLVNNLGARDTAKLDCMYACTRTVLVVHTRTFKRIKRLRLGVNIADEREGESPKPEKYQGKWDEIFDSGLNRSSRCSEIMNNVRSFSFVCTEHFWGPMEGSKFTCAT